VTTRCGVLGDPIAHSLSPVLHRAGYDALGLDDWQYDAEQVAAGALASYLAGLGPQWRGLSLTMPLKREAVGLLDAASEDVRRSGAANTLVLEDGLVHGHNTDVAGAAAAVRERYDDPLDEALILGGGATATSTGLALLDLGAARLRVAVRDAARADETVAALRAHPAAAEVVVESLAGPAASTADVVVSTIPASAQTPDVVARCAGVPLVFEVLYDPWPTPLAASVGDRVLVGGLDLLVHQAALQFELFTGRSAPLDTMRAAGAETLAQRSRS
jgi:shikimate dehydrogenase